MIETSNPQPAETYRRHEIRREDGMSLRDARRAIDAKIEAEDRAYVEAHPDERTPMETTGWVWLDWLVLSWLTIPIRVSNRAIRRRRCA
jgi:hypothetical protein